MSMPRPYIVEVELNNRLQRYERGILLGTDDGYADRFGANVMRGGKAADLSSYTVKGYFLRPDGTTVTLDGTIDGNKATVVLLPNCYSYDGAFTLSIKLHSSGSYAHTLAIFDGTIAQTTTDTVIDSGDAFSPSDAVLRRNNYNLLDNSYFANVINQRGASSYTGTAYGIDRWYGRVQAMTTQVRSADVTITATGTSFAGIRQKIENIADYAGKTVTFAVKLYCSVLPEIAIRDASDTSIARKVGTGQATQILCVSCEVPADATPDSFVPTIMVRASAAGDYARLYWAAVYEGAYTAENLPPYEYKGYAAELAECQRYFRRIKAESTYGSIGVGMAQTTTTAWINVPRTRMRLGKPTVTIGGDTLRIYAGSTATEATGIAVDKISDSYIRLTATISGIANGAAIVATSGATSNFYIDENADL